MMTNGTRKASVHFWLALACWLGAVILIGAYFGMCANVPTDVLPDETGGKGEWPVILFALILGGVGYFYFWPRRYRPMR